MSALASASTLAADATRPPVVLPAPPPEKIASYIPGKPIVMISSSGTPGARVGPLPSNVLPFGSAFWNLMGPLIMPDPSAGARKGGASKAKKVPAAHEFPDELIKVPTKVKPKNLHKYNFYYLLGLGDHADAADESAIRKGYHKCVLLYHPDKRQDKTEAGTEDNSVWLKIQEAFATLLDKNKRRAYDSQLPFDDK